MALSKDQRRALKLLLDTSPQGCDKSMLLAWGLKVDTLGRLDSGFTASRYPEMTVQMFCMAEPHDHRRPLSSHQRCGMGTRRSLATVTVSPGHSDGRSITAAGMFVGSQLIAPQERN